MEKVSAKPGTKKRTSIMERGGYEKKEGEKFRDRTRMKVL